MKYLRTYEGLEYTDGDRVILDIEQLLKNYSKLSMSGSDSLNFIKNLDSNNDYIHIIKVDKSPWTNYNYSFPHYNWKSDRFFIMPTEIFGLATPDNIKKYELIRTMKKFNV